MTPWGVTGDGEPVDWPALLRAPFPPAAIGKLPRKNKNGQTVHLDYVGHAAVTDRLLQVDPTWTWEPVASNEHGEPLIVTRGNVCRLWIRLTVCGMTRLGVGTVAADTFDVEKQLIGDALRNAAMRFGVALDLWSKEELSGVEVAAGPVVAGSKASSVSSGESSGGDVPAATSASVEAGVPASDRTGQGVGKSGSGGRSFQPPSAAGPSSADEMVVGESTMKLLRSRVSALVADKVEVSEYRKARKLPTLRQPLTDEQAEGWKKLLDDLEAGLEAPFV